MIIPTPAAKREQFDNFSPEQIAELRAEFGKKETMTPDVLPKFHALFETMTDTALVNICRANIKFVSRLAFNAALRRGITGEEIKNARLSPSPAGETGGRQRQPSRKKQNKMNILNESEIFETGCGSIPKMYADGVAGLGAKIAAAADVVAGHIVRFAVCDREQAGLPVVREIIAWGLGDGGDVLEGYQPRCVRFCGESGNPDGCGSHSLIPSWYPYCADEGAIAAAMTGDLARRSPSCFRLKNLN